MISYKHGSLRGRRWPGPQYHSCEARTGTYQRPWLEEPEPFRMGITYSDDYMSGYSDLLLVVDYAASEMIVYSNWSITFKPLAGDGCSSPTSLNLSPDFQWFSTRAQTQCRGLRVTLPESAQRSTYFLLLHTHFTAPLTLTSGVLR